MDDSQSNTALLLDHSGVLSAPGSQTGSHLGHTPNLSRQEFVSNANLYLPIRSPDGSMPGSSPAKHPLAEKSPHGHQSLMTSPIPTSGMFTDDQFLILSLDGNVYDQGPGGGVAHGNHLQADFNLDSIDFMVLDDLGSESRAFPPLNFPQNTPALAAHSHASIMRSLLPGVIQSPMLPGQNLKSYNQEHLYHKQRQQQQQQHRQLQSLISSLSGRAPKHIRPDAVFTPLVSPAGTPLDILMNTNGQQSAQLRDFEPLTSPALKAQPQGPPHVSLQSRPSLHSIPSSDRIRPLSTLGTDDYTSGNCAKRKTPHLTPHLTPNLAAHSSLKSKSPMLNKVPPSFEKLPEASFEGMGAPAKSTETTPMLPPQGKRVAIEPGSGLTPGSGGPGPMMGFTMNRLAEQQSVSYDSPSTGKILKNTRRLSRSSSQRSVDYSAKQYASSLSETSPMLEAQSDHADFGSSRNGKMPTKKASHKLAEQGRRNRMNNAIQELSLLIPPEFHEKAPIPSKATTVELAAEYISTLLNEIEGLKQMKADKPVRVKKEYL